MATGINGVISLLQTINLSINGITSAPLANNYPRGEVNEADMPMALVFVESGNGTRHALGLQRIERSYVIMFLCFNTATGILTEQLYDTHELMDKVLKKYLNEALLQAPTVTLNEIAISYPQQIIASGWMENLIYNGVEYQGFTITIPIHEKGTLA